MFQGIADGSQATRPAPMAELTVGAFAMELRATAPAVGQASDGWVGRPVAVLAICRRTLMVAGVHLAEDGVSYYDMLRCLADAFLPRDAAEFGAAGYWPCEGVAERVFVHARHDLVPAPVRRFRQALGIEIVRHEDYEPFVGDLAERWSQETGIEVDPVQEGRSAITHMLAGRKPEGDEVPLSEIDRRLRRWIVDRYNAVPVPGIERSPLDLWREAAVGFVPRFVPADAPGDLFRPDRFRIIGPRGVSWGGRTYWSEAVPELVERWGESRTYEVRSDPTDITRVEICTPERKWVRLNARWV
ncbi:Mu transposase C-terminal domain-containing protein [Aureimonas sp. ME7]|uniref:Mu transposase C-terminal domain-containing protein n=1 Tax=Aureimonas sp. ME7 TaxID=2744252 RepID=UPI0015F53F39|nr:Mu transposase C-terminal domain-containing protein [Aureimonas sp. ME7]